MSDAHPNPPQRLLIFGGTFDPPHAAHAQLPARVAQQLECDLILYVPAAVNPLKDQPHASAEHRLAMLLLALADVPHARLSTIELDRAGPSYTIDTLRALRREFGPTPEFRLLIGCDQALEFQRWKDWRDILALATPAVMLRPPWTDESFRAALQQRYAPAEAQQWMHWTVRLPLLDVSATDVRTALVRHDVHALEKWLDPAVLAYIRKNELYL